MPHPTSGKAEVLPLFPLGTVLVPGMRLSLHVFEPRYRQLVADLLSAEGPGAPEFGVVALRQGWEVGELGDVHDVGTSARVTDVLPHTDGRCDLAAVGECRFLVESLDTGSKPYLVGTVRRLAEPDGELRPGLAGSVRRALEAHVRTLAELNADLGVLAEDSDPGTDPRALSYLVAKLPSLPVADRQSLLGVADTATRLRAGRAVLRRETELMRQLRAVPITASTFRRPGAS
ncbi:LON peptidase substrate-binding domain-containing protein [Jatrophihabitans sp.]|uniref:LON peptidase substrate-binding domain-containing protein n=1 Tax=Jatrophihabitans sp. TaxID=1932789 RepID=UPI002EFE250D